MFAERNLIIATQHQKENVIAPILESEFLVNCIVPPNFDTDRFGTFSGEIERSNDPFTTARNKCIAGMEIADCDLGIASEGSFGPHPDLFFIPSDDEILIFIDKKNQLEIIERVISTSTNFRQAEITNIDDLKNFATSIGFPSHGLIIKKSKDELISIKKGIVRWSDLIRSFNDVMEINNSVWVETDMRAMYNPTRMKVIEEATQKLVAKIKNHCPNCNCPGFSIKEVIQGLPCEYCHYPTRGILQHVYKCSRCNYVKEEKFPLGKEKESQMYCDICNP